MNIYLPLAIGILLLLLTFGWKHLQLLYWYRITKKHRREMASIAQDLPLWTLDECLEVQKSLNAVLNENLFSMQRLLQRQEFLSTLVLGELARFYNLNLYVRDLLELRLKETTNAPS